MATFDINKQYAFIDTDGLIHAIAGSELVDSGVWSSAPFYVRYNVVAYQTALYVALTSVSVYPPTAIYDENWSSLVDITEGTGDLTLEEVYNLALGANTTAYAAIQTAWRGTNLAYTALQTAWTGTNLASQANSLAATGLQTAWTGTTLATQSGSVAYTALQTAWTGTDLAASAYALAASSGSYTGTVAYSALLVAWQGTELAYAALQTAWTGTALGAAGTNLAYAALQTAWSGTRTADQALQAAWTGTALGATAIQTAWAGTATANTAYSISVSGTNAAAAAISLANEALVLAQAGTVVPALNDLTDVSVPAPTAQTVLTFDGSLWVAVAAPSTVSPEAVTYYLDDNTVGTLAYRTLALVPQGGTEEADSVTVSTSTGPGFIDGYISEALNRTRLDAGLWEFNTYASVSNAARPARFVTDVLKRSDAGTVAYLFSGTSELVSSTTPVLTTYLSVQGSFAVDTTDRLIAQYWALPTTVPSVIATMYHNGTEHYSHFHTPLGLAHNDLAGLQGGATGEYYHATANQAGALAGVGGTPTAANPFVTNTDTRLATATSAYALAQEAYNIALAGTQSGTYSGTLAQQAYDLALQAFSLAAIGTNVGTNAYDLAGEARATAISAYGIASIGTNVGTNAYVLAAEAQATAAVAYNIALAGTTLVGAAYNLAAIGTNVGTNAYSAAIEAKDTGTLAYNAAMEAKDTGTLAYNTALSAAGGALLAQQAYALASIGTNVGTNALLLAAPAQFGLTVDNGASVVTTGVKGYVRIPQDLYITGWAVYADQAGSCVFDVWKTNLAGYPPTVANTITGASKPTLGGLAANEGVVSGASGWTRTVAAGDYVGFNLDSASVVTRAHLAVFGTH